MYKDNFSLENTRRNLSSLIAFLNKHSLKENDFLLNEAVTGLMEAQSNLNKYSRKIQLLLKQGDI